MKYEIRTPALLGEIVPLHAVAVAKAEARASAGGLPLHRPTYDGCLREYIADLLAEARAGRLKVCSQFGSPGTVDELLDADRRKGRLVLPTNEPDPDLEHILALYAALQWLNEWSASRGDEFGVTHEGVKWIDERGIHGAKAHQAPMVDSAAVIDYSLLADKHQLIHAFETLTGMNLGWFRALKDKPGLLGARVTEGRGRRGRGQSIEPLFCPYRVTKWLAEPSRRVGYLRARPGALWALLNTHFPKVYAAHADEDPRYQ